MDDDLVALAARLWKAEAEDVGMPPSVAERRNLEAFLDDAQVSDKTRRRWMKFARAAHEHYAARIEADAARDLLAKDRGQRARAAREKEG